MLITQITIKHRMSIDLAPCSLLGCFLWLYQIRLLAHQWAYNMHKYLHPNLFYNGCHFWRHTIMPCSFLTGYPAASVTNTEHIVSCSSAAHLPTPPAFQPWHNLQFKPNSICSTHGKCMKNEPYSSCSGSGREGLFLADFWLPLPGAWRDVFRSRPSIGYWSCAARQCFPWSWLGGTHTFSTFSKPAKSRAT